MINLKNFGFLLLLFVISIFAFLPHSEIPKDIDYFNANYKHVFAFFTISLYLYSYKSTTFLNVLFFILLFGFYIEIFQGLFTTREFSLYDVIYDLLGYLMLIILVISKGILDKIPHNLIIYNKGNICQNKK